MFENFYFAFFGNSAWTNMFTLDETVFWIEKILRPILVYAALIILLRLFGKRELGQLNPFDLVVILSLSNTVQNAIIGEDNSLVGGVVGAIALLGANYAVAFLKFKDTRIERFVEGNHLVIVENSKIKDSAVKRELLTDNDLDTIAHREGLANRHEIEKCVLDPNGGFLVEGNTKTSEEKFRHEVLARLEDLTNQMKDLKK